MTERRGASPQHGFTLIEMLVALAVFALAALALLRLQAVSLRTASELDERQMAQIVAHNLMVERLTDPALPPLGQRQGDSQNGGRRWHWTESVSAGGAPDVVRVDVVVEAQGSGSSRATLSFLRGQP
ncbi:type II secretion system minor pseudopilin GspI [Sphingobium subterraneum]|uniref:Type II secretion system protein I n=1 Tax=Sphingobium subterraneum TaxID=627688 RepID=A0A841J331_9SPHN|nr:general secretion pathway protein I [Sphingobium subterraneum]